MNRLTLVDELLPGRKLFAVNQGTRFTDAKPWRYKYDFHRHRGNKGDYLEYRVDGIITGVRIYSFFPRRSAEFRVMFYDDAATPSASSVQATEYPYCCANPKDRLRLPVLFRTSSVPTGNNRVRIFFPEGGAEVGRCEVDFLR